MTQSFQICSTRWTSQTIPVALLVVSKPHHVLLAAVRVSLSAESLRLISLSLQHTSTLQSRRICRLNGEELASPYVPRSRPLTNNYESLSSRIVLP